MKRYFSTFLMLFLVFNLTAQKDFRKGYITTLTNETILVDIYIPYNGKIQTKKNDGKTIKYKRRSLADYGYLIDGEKKSQFAATAFPIITYEGYYVTFNDDTIKGYFTNWTSSQIALYKKGNQKKTKLSPSDNVKGFCIKRGTTEEWYDQIDYTVKLGLLDSEVNSRQFCRPEIEGTMMLYKTQYTIHYPGHVGANGMMTGGSSQTYPIYVFAVGDKIHALEYRPLRSKDKVLRDLKEAFSYYPELYESIDKSSFTKSDIPDLVRQYNEYFENN